MSNLYDVATERFGLVQVERDNIEALRKSPTHLDEYDAKTHTVWCEGEAPPRRMRE